MKFYGEPLLLVRLQKNIGSIRFIRFDNNGEFETDNPRLIKKLSTKFKSELIEKIEEEKPKPKRRKSIQKGAK